MRFIELYHLHFYGRAPRSQEEISTHIALINEQGYAAEINSYVDSNEYEALFGASRVPAPNFQGGYLYNTGMNKLAYLKGGDATADSVQKTQMLECGDGPLRVSSTSILRGLPSAWKGENAARAQAGLASDFPDVFWNLDADVLRQEELSWKMRYGVWNNFWYKDSIVYTDVKRPRTSHTDGEVKEADSVLKWGSNMAKMYRRIWCRRCELE